MACKFLSLLASASLVLILSDFGKCSLLTIENSIHKIDVIQDETMKWEPVCERVVEMMLNSDVAQDGKLNVLIFPISNFYFTAQYVGFEMVLSKHANTNIAFSSFMAGSVMLDVQADFVILLLDDDDISHETFSVNTFGKIFEDQTTKFFVIMRSTRLLESTWMSLLQQRYYNFYFIIQSDGSNFEVLQNKIIGTGSSATLELATTESRKYQTVREVLTIDQIGEYNVVSYDLYPMSYVENNEIVGPLGNLLRELNKKLNISHYILNEENSRPSLPTIYQYMTFVGDICLHNSIDIHTKRFSSVWLNEVDGFCLLVPRNVRVSTYENFTFPLDNASMIMALVSTILVIISWKIVSICTNNERSMTSILFAVYELTLNLGALGIERLSLPEKFLVFSYIFSSFILVSFYESIFMSLMLMEPTMRSATSIGELNNRSAKFYSYFDRDSNLQVDVPYVREELIINKINLLESFSLNVPHQFDENLVYLVLCQYGNNFVRSSQNMRDNSRLFDVIPISETYQTILVRKGFYFIDEFKKLTKTLEESGIYSFWEKQTVEDAHEKFKVSKDEELTLFDIIYFEGMIVPIVVLLIGCLLSFAVFMFEIFTSKYMRPLLDRLKLFRNKVHDHRVRKKIVLTKWLKKYHYKRKRKALQYLKARQDKLIPVTDEMMPIKSKDHLMESRKIVADGYFALKRFKNAQRKKVKRRVIQVQPCEAETSV